MRKNLQTIFYRKYFSLSCILLVIGLGTLSANAQVCFTPASPATVAVDNSPQSIVTADFNGDGIADLAISNETTSDVSILIGKGNGTFDAAVNYPVGSAPYSILLNDFNGDGKIDIATTNINSVSVLISNGNGTFSTAITSAAGGGSQLGVSADFNHDGKADYIVPDGYTNSTISVLLGVGNGTFGPVTQFSDGGVSTQSIAAGDFDGDGNLDIAICNQVSNNISIMKGDGLGGFTLFTGSPFTCGQTPTSIVTDDFNRDGKLDLAVTNFADNTLSIFLGNGDGTFGAATNYPVGTEPRQVTIGDLNGDSIPDLAVANQVANDVTVLLGTGAGTFTLAINCCGTDSVPAGSAPYSVAIADYNGDGRADMAVANRASDNVSILLNLASSQPPAVTAITNAPVCTSGTLSLTGGPAAMKSYSWSGPNGYTSSIQSPGISNLSIADAGVYSLNVTDSLGCNGTASTAFVTIDSAFVADAGANMAICAGANTNLSGAGGTVYAWSPATGLSCTKCANPSANPTATTTYFFTATDGACSSTDSVIISVTQGFILNTTPADTTICSGNTATLISSGATTYTWNPSANLTCTTCANPVASPAISTTYTVTGFNGSCSYSDTVVVTVGNTANAGAISTARDTLCEGTRGNLNLSGNSSNIIQWQSSITTGNFTSITGAVDTTDYQTQPLSQTTWYRVVVGSGSCIAVSDSFSLYVPPVLTAKYNFTSSGATITFNSDSSSGNIISYSWTFGDGSLSTDKNPAHTYSKTDTTYNVCLTIYDGSNCSYTFCKDVSLLLGIAPISALTKWNIYPIPFSDNLFINGIATANFIQRVEIYDVLGRLVFIHSYNTPQNILQLNLSGLAQGMYALKIKTGDTEYVQPVIKQQP